MFPVFQVMMVVTSSFRITHLVMLIFLPLLIQRPSRFSLLQHQEILTLRLPVQMEEKVMINLHMLETMV